MIKWNKGEGCMKIAWQKHLGEVNCPRCGEVYHKPELGSYRCLKCGFYEKVDPGLVRSCYEQAGGVTTKKEATTYAGITEKRLDQVHKELRDEFDKLERDKHACNKCGTTIMYGRYCEKCKRQLANSIKIQF